MEALLLERVMANFTGTSVWLFEKKKNRQDVSLVFLVKGTFSAFLGAHVYMHVEE